PPNFQPTRNEIPPQPPSPVHLEIHVRAVCFSQQETIEIREPNDNQVFQVKLTPQMQGNRVRLARATRRGADVYIQFHVLHEFTLPSRSTGSGPGPSPQTDDLAELRNNLRLKVMGDEARIDALIECERLTNPHASLAELMRGAIRQWERDNR